MGNIAYIVLDDETLEVEDTKARTDIGDVSTLQTATKDNLVNAVNECFQFASDGKALIASAITGKGIDTDSDATFAVMAGNIAAIETGVDTSDATATAAQILSGAIAYVGGNKITGTMANKSATTEYTATAALDSTNSELEMTVPATGYYTTNNKLKATFAAIASLIGLTSAKLASGNTILGIAGNSNVVDTSAGTATAAQILEGNSAYVDGVQITGTMKNYATGTPNEIPYYRTNDTENRYEIAVNDGYHSSWFDGGMYEYLPYSTLAASLGLSADKLLTGNTICGIAGTAVSGKKYASGTAYSIGSHPNAELIYWRTLQASDESSRSSNGYTIAVDPGFAASILKVYYVIVSGTAAYYYTAVLRYDGTSFQFDCLDDTYGNQGSQELGYSCYFQGYAAPRVGNIFYLPSAHLYTSIEEVVWEAWE